MMNEHQDDVLAADGHPPTPQEARPVSPGRDEPENPLPVLAGLTALVRLRKLYPAGHPVVDQSLEALQEALNGHLGRAEHLRIDIIRGDAHVEGYPFRIESQENQRPIRELREMEVHSLHFSRGVSKEELSSVAGILSEMGERGVAPGPLAEELARRGVERVNLGKLVQLDTRWGRYDWPDAPDGISDPDYLESLSRAEDAFSPLVEGKPMDVTAVRDLLQLLTSKVVQSSAALSQILAVKHYENHTYCHSVNVAVLSLVIGRRTGLDDASLSDLAEAALLHDVGKIRIPIEVLKKPGALSRRERQLIERHPKYGAEVLITVPGLAPLTPTVALEHHREVAGGGYPDLEGNQVPHMMSQLVAVADTYEALTGARSYREPALPEEACLILARMAGQKLNPAIVKAFVSTISFFPLGTVVRTNRGEIGVVIETVCDEPLHPLISLVRVSPDGDPPLTRIDTSRRTTSGDYERHVVETLLPVDLDVGEHFVSADDDYQSLRRVG
jgi:HD-GYP domain-containing protein (c-di-GMP phosphodiesterase class II)